MSYMDFSYLKPSCTPTQTGVTGTPSPTYTETPAPTVSGTGSSATKNSGSSSSINKTPNVGTFDLEKIADLVLDGDLKAVLEELDKYNVSYIKAEKNGDTNLTFKWNGLKYTFSFQGITIDDDDDGGNTSGTSGVGGSSSVDTPKEITDEQIQAQIDKWIGAWVKDYKAHTSAWTFGAATAPSERSVKDFEARLKELCKANFADLKAKNDISDATVKSWVRGQVVGEDGKTQYKGMAETIRDEVKNMAKTVDSHIETWVNDFKTGYTRWGLDSAPTDAEVDKFRKRLKENCDAKFEAFKAEGYASADTISQWVRTNCNGIAEEIKTDRANAAKGADKVDTPKEITDEQIQAQIDKHIALWVNDYKAHTSAWTFGAATAPSERSVKDFEARLKELCKANFADLKAKNDISDSTVSSWVRGQVVGEDGKTEYKGMAETIRDEIKNMSKTVDSHIETWVNDFKTGYTRWGLDSAPTDAEVDKFRKLLKGNCNANFEAFKAEGYASSDTISQWVRTNCNGIAEQIKIGRSENGAISKDDVPNLAVKNTCEQLISLINDQLKEALEDNITEVNNTRYKTREAIIEDFWNKFMEDFDIANKFAKIDLSPIGGEDGLKKIIDTTLRAISNLSDFPANFTNLLSQIKDNTDLMDVIETDIPNLAENYTGSKYEINLHNVNSNDNRGEKALFDRTMRDVFEKLCETYPQYSRDNLKEIFDSCVDSRLKTLPYQDTMQNLVKQVLESFERKFCGAITRGEIKFADSTEETGRAKANSRAGASEMDDATKTKISDAVTSLTEDLPREFIWTHFLNDYKDGAKENMSFNIVDGKIDFEDTDAMAIYVDAYAILTGAMSENDINAIGGEAVLNALFQAAWINSYKIDKDFDMHKVNIKDFLNDVKANFTTMLENIVKDPELLSLIVNLVDDGTITPQAPAYKNPAALEGLENYNDYKTEVNFAYSTQEDGSIKLQDDKQDALYQEAMDKLFANLCKMYPEISTDDLSRIFEKAKYNAARVTGNTQYHDIPHGCGDNSGWDYHSNNAKATLGAVIQLTLYNFDKLLYEELKTGSYKELKE